MSQGFCTGISQTKNLIKSQIHFHPACCLFLLFFFCGFCWNNISYLYRLPLFFRKWVPLKFLLLSYGWSSVENRLPPAHQKFKTKDFSFRQIWTKPYCWLINFKKRRAHQLNKLSLYISLSSNIYFQGKSSSCKYYILNLHIAGPIIQFLSLLRKWQRSIQCKAI